MMRAVSFSEDLVSALAKDLLSKYEKTPFELAKVQVVLPTKRACLAFKNAFLQRGKDRGLLLPHLVSLYELDVLEADIPPAISNTTRLLLLTKLCMAKPNILGVDQALKMAMSLTELLDLAYQFDLDLSNLKTLVPLEQFSEHWQQTVAFLDILHTHWPKILEEKGQLDPMDRNIRLIRAFTKQVSSQASTAPIVLAGFTDLFPALNELIEVVKQHDNNLILLDNYVPKGNQDIPYYTTKHVPQEGAVMEALTKESWTNISLPKDSFKNVCLLTSNTLSEEALSIALLLREALEKPKQTAALVTTDRNLARQVIGQMKRWEIELDDSAGTPLNHTEIGTFLSLIVDVGMHPDGQTFLSLLKHPLATDTKPFGQLHHLVQLQEKHLRKENKAWEMTLETDFHRWIAIFQNNVLIPFTEILKQHIEIAEKLAISTDKTAMERLWQTEAGKLAFELICELLNEGEILGMIEPACYADTLKLFMQKISMRPKYGMHPRLDILGPIEARFYHPDICIIGGLNEEIFPPLVETGPWLNRLMRQQLGLPLPEATTETLAMDFAHCFCSSKVYLTRSLKKDGAESVPSRFIERLKAVAEVNQLSFPEKSSHLAKLLDLPEEYDSVSRPTPCPPAEARPSRLPVTQIEMWRRNPYAIYARYILKLYPLYPLEDVQDNQMFGTLVHATIEQFLQQDPNSIDKEKFVRLASELFKNSRLSPMTKKIFSLKFEAISDFFIAQQQKNLSLVKTSYPERPLSTHLNVQGRDFELYGKVDRIDLLKDTTLRIIDFKTGEPPSINSVKAGYTPQLTLEAFLLSQSSEQPFLNKKISQLSYWHLDGKQGKSYTQDIVDSESELSDLIKKTKEGLEKLIATFQNANIPYEVCPIPAQAPTYNDYAHLARMQEWAFEEENT